MGDSKLQQKNRKIWNAVLIRRFKMFHSLGVSHKITILKAKIKVIDGTHLYLDPSWWGSQDVVPGKIILLNKQ